MQFVNELLMLAALNKEVYARGKTTLVVSGRAWGYFLSAQVVHRMFIDRGIIKENDFAFPNWHDLQSWREQNSPSSATPS